MLRNPEIYAYINIEDKPRLYQIILPGMQIIYYNGTEMKMPRIS